MTDQDENSSFGSKSKVDGEQKREDYYAYELYPERRDRNEWSVLESLFGGRARSAYERNSCERKVLTVLKKNPLVRILINALNNAGCKVDIGRNICCEVCDNRVTGGYDAEWNQIVICQNSVKSRRYPEVTLIHELIHMYDYCVNDVDFKNNEHLACTEIRAANLTHCSFISSFLLAQSSLFNIKQTHQYCVKIKAAQSLMVSRNLDFDTALKYVLKVFDKCYSDLEPIGRRVKRNSNDCFMAYKESIHYGYSHPSEDEKPE